MITHDVDEAILLADKIVLMTNGPHAKIAEIVVNTMPRDRSRHDLHKHPHYYRHPQPPDRFPGRSLRSFAADEGGTHDPRHVPLVRPGVTPTLTAMPSPRAQAGPLPGGEGWGEGGYARCSVTTRSASRWRLPTGSEAGRRRHDATVITPGRPRRAGGRADQERPTSRDNGWSWNTCCGTIGKEWTVPPHCSARCKMTKPMAEKAAELFGLSKSGRGAAAARCR